MLKKLSHLQANATNVSSNQRVNLSFQLRQKILEAHTNVKDLNLVEAKMNFVKAWQSLPDYGVSLFVVRYVKVKVKTIHCKLRKS